MITTIHCEYYYHFVNYNGLLIKLDVMKRLLSDYQVYTQISKRRDIIERVMCPQKPTLIENSIILGL